VSGVKSAARRCAMPLRGTLDAGPRLTWRLEQARDKPGPGAEEDVVAEIEAGQRARWAEVSVWVLWTGLGPEAGQCGVQAEGGELAVVAARDLVPG
jgi:hypothetical protein